MAALKKSRKAGKSGAGLAIALVFFILLSIGLGVWGYYGYKGQEDLRKLAKEADLAKTAAKAGEDYFKFLAWDFQLALGHPLDKDAKAKYPGLRDSFMAHHDSADGAGDFKALGKPVKEHKDIVDDNNKELAYNKDETRYNLNYKDRLAAAVKRVVDVESTSEGRSAALIKQEALYDSLKKKIDGFWTQTLERIQKGNEEAIAEARMKYAEFEKLLADNRDLSDRINALQKTKDDEEVKLLRKIKDLDDALKVARAEKPEGGAGGGAAPLARGEPHALLLDVSGFRPLWDRPLGEISSLDLTNRLVYIRPNRNVDRPFKTGLTFLVFAAGADGGAAGQLKASLEVVREVDRTTYACRLTSFYDVDRGEIYLPDPAKLASIRTSRNALKEGDLVFNMFFGSRVALAGVFDLDGDPGNNPAEMSRKLEATIASLSRRGIDVDAWIDPLTGAIKGAITSRTRFLIRGDEIDVAAMGDGAPAPMMPKEAMKEGDEKGPKEMPPPADGGSPFAASLAQMRAQAIEKGLFIISRPNFTTVIGYYSPRHLGETAKISRLPSLVAATTLATATLSFIGRDEMNVADFAGEWEGAGWEMSISKDGKAKVSMVTDRAGVPEIRVAPGELSKRSGKITMTIAGPTPLDLNAQISAGGTAIMLEDNDGKMVPPRVTLRKR